MPRYRSVIITERWCSIADTRFSAPSYPASTRESKYARAPERDWDPVPGVHLVKQVLKKLMIWYLRFLAVQISAFGQATARFGVTVASRIDELESEVAELRERVAKLERP